MSNNKILKFNINGPFAFFKNPEVNTYHYFTFNNIHKVAIMGIFGAALGLKGYNQQGDSRYPEFYEKLKGLEVAIVPKSPVCPVKKVQTFNNSTMFFNKGADKEGANLIVKEEWIENPSWDIYVKLNNKNALHQELLECFIERNFKYVPYLGKNDHFANIENVEVFDLGDIETVKEDSFELNSFYLRGDFIEADSLSLFDEGDISFKYKESLPFGLNEHTNHYWYKTVEYCSGNVEFINKNATVYNINGINITFM